ncbi:extracellular tyrosine-protein kinase PKDCC-like isoform X2 [Ischnura elegans]|uniref:extracellular tyrosine-protein kinase PKDCC-like isoform X2 n=1 Tax=Ischnura elegans TaxID=197161 RepID=UPI001ED877D9|nr:extracellular tyrosine-protein kinase PKDCC-like isoform X2 [Ischnura elegans]
MSPEASSPGVCVFVCAYVSIFAVAGVLLYGPTLVSRGGTDGVGAVLAAGRRPGRPASSSALRLAIEEGAAGNWEVRSLPDGGAFPNHHQRYGSWNGSGSEGAEGSGGAAGRVYECTAVHSASDLEFVAGGWTKAVYRAKVGGRDVAIKTVNLNGHDVRECQRVGGSASACYRRAAAKILREMVLLGQLKHDNIVEVLGSCIPDAVGPVAMVTELGDPLDTVRLLQLSWEDRLRLALGMARILHRLAHSPLGSLAMNDFRRQQFVTVGGTTLKLSDVDDVGVTEPSCTTADDCLQRLPSEMLNESSGVHHSSSPCIEGRCVGHNEKLNVWHAGRHFIRLFLPLSAPSSLEPHIQELLEAYKTAKWNSEQILDATERLVSSFISGDYRDASVEHETQKPISPEVVNVGYDIPKGKAGNLQSLGFEMVPDSDLPGMFDYRCHDSTSAVGCVISVFNELEAAEICAKDPDCKAVVLGQEHTWTGRTIAIFKNGYGTPSVKMGYSLLLRKR